MFEKILLISGVVLYLGIFSDFVNGYRLDETLRLKERYPEMTVAEAVAKAGFGSTSSFSSTYKKGTVSPLVGTLKAYKTQRNEKS